jgi:NADP-dependent aldehyde dehydrogenase
MRTDARAETSGLPKLDARIEGLNLIGHDLRPGTGAPIRATEAATGLPLDPTWHEVSTDDLGRACALAEAAARPFRDTGTAARAAFLERIAANILDLGDDLVIRCMAETGLPRARIEGERQRTVNQLRLFAEAIRDGGHIEGRHDPALPTRVPPRPDLRLTHLPLGPVAVFAASNFPLAFSVAGGDTASALAAGCPVIVKAHSAHPGTSELVGRAVRQAVHDTCMPKGTFSLVYGSGSRIGQALAADSRIRAIGFTGSRSGGLALLQTAQARPVPIPVYAEMSSINPVFLFPAALQARAEPIAADFVTALTLGAGQFCTNPGLVIAIDSPASRRFVTAAATALSVRAPQVMLTPAIAQSYAAGVARLAAHPAVRTETMVPPAGRTTQGPALFSASAARFLADPALQEEVFGAASLVVLCEALDDFARIARALEGQLTAALHIDPDDHPAARALLPDLADLAGRIIANGFGTGVEVAHAMVHGGPFPATSDGRSTSVGSLAIRRFLRPFAWQNLPQALLSGREAVD